MGKLIGIVGPPGSGKTTSILPIPDHGIEGLNPKQTIYINVARKELPMRRPDQHYNPNVPISKGGNYASESNAHTIVEIIRYVSEHRPEIKNIVIDDMGYIMSFDVIRRVSEKSYDKWTEIARDTFQITEVVRDVRPELVVFCMFHLEQSKEGSMKIKTAGQLLDKEISLDGLFTILLYADPDIDYGIHSTRYRFRTQSLNDTAKSPLGMFEDNFIDNDLGKVRRAVVDYYGLEEEFESSDSERVH